MPRGPGGPFAPTSTSLGGLLRSDMRDLAALPRPPSGMATFPTQSDIAAADAVIPKRVREVSFKREEAVKGEAASIAQRYLSERDKKAPSMESVWGAARLGHRGIYLTNPALDPKAKARVPKHVKAAFDAFDANSSGFLDYRELRHALTYMGINVPNDQAAQSVIYAYDDHPDGKLDLIEFAKLCEDVELRGGVAADTSATFGRLEGNIPPKVKAAFELFDEDGNGFIEAPELRRALRHYGIDLSEADTAEVLLAYDDNPDEKLDLSEFAKVIADATRGFVFGKDGLVRTGKGGSFKPGTAEANADRAAARLATFGSNKGYMGLGEWPQHNEEAARMDRIRDELNRDGFNAVRKEGFWGDPNGEWVRGQLMREQDSRRTAQEEAKVAKAEAAAAIARVEALQAAAAARELEIEAAAARLHRTEMIQTVPPATGGGGGSGKKEDEKDVLPPSTSGDIAKWTTPNGNARQAAYNAISAAPLGRSGVGIDKDVEKRRKVILSSLVERLEVSLLDHLDNRAITDSERARAHVLLKVFRGPMVGSRPTDKYASRDAFLAAFGVLGLPQPPSVLPPTQENTLKQPVVSSDEALNKEVLYEFFKKYAEDNGLLNYETLYSRVAKNAVRRAHGESKSQATIQKEYADQIGGGSSNYKPPASNYNPRSYWPSGRPFESGGVQRQKGLLGSVVSDRTGVMKRN